MSVSVDDARVSVNEVCCSVLQFVLECVGVCRWTMMGFVSEV